VEDEINAQTAYYSLEILEIIDALTEGDHFGDVVSEKLAVLNINW
jgi:hypothetical protein